jgi:hypothetical protein
LKLLERGKVNLPPHSHQINMLYSSTHSSLGIVVATIGQHHFLISPMSCQSSNDFSKSSLHRHLMQDIFRFGLLRFWAKPFIALMWVSNMSCYNSDGIELTVVGQAERKSQ